MIASLSLFHSRIFLTICYEICFLCRGKMNLIFYISLNMKAISSKSLQPKNCKDVCLACCWHHLRAFFKHRGICFAKDSCGREAGSRDEKCWKNMQDYQMAGRSTRFKVDGSQKLIKRDKMFGKAAARWRWPLGIRIARGSRYECVCFV